MSFDVIVRGGTLVSGDGIQETDLGISKGKIVEIGNMAQKEGREIVDAKGLHVFAGVIDTQVHFREPGMEHKEDLESGTRSAITGGVTTIFEMPNTNPLTTSEERLKDKLNRARGRAWCDYSFFVGAATDNVDQLAYLESLPGTPGIKIFMGSSTGTLLVPDDETLLKVLQNGRLRCPVHSEDHYRLESRKTLQKGSPSAHVHPTWRDSEAARLSTERLISLANKANRPIHVLHVSTADELPLIQGAKRRGQDVTAEITPQHLWFSGPDVYDKLGTYAQMNPPMREKTHTLALREALKSGIFDVFGSDHAPHTFDEKNNAYPTTPSGMPGVQTLTPALLTLITQELDMDIRVFARMASERPAEIYGIKNKGFLKIGYDADLTLVDLERKLQPVRSPGQVNSIQSKCGWSPYEGIDLVGWATKTMLAGKVVWNEGELIGDPSGSPAAFHRG